MGAVHDPDVDQTVVEPGTSRRGEAGRDVAAIAEEHHPGLHAPAVQLDADRLTVSQHPGQRHEDRGPLANGLLDQLVS
ncbi:MAG: hypothetical protein M3O70_22500 [Actinomycetota bacterium]|nr:hypothetical protein [Actinomycetota bacterium]